MKEKEVVDIMEAMKELDESSPARPVIFVDQPSVIMLPTVPSTSNNHTINNDDNVRHRLTILEMQMAEMMTVKMTSASSPAPMEHPAPMELPVPRELSAQRDLPAPRKLPASKEPSLQEEWSRDRQSSQHASHFIQQPTVQQSPAQLPTSQVDVLTQNTAGAPLASLP